MLKTPFQNNAHFSLHWGWFCIFYLKKGYFLNSKRKKTVFSVTAAVCQLKERFSLSWEVRLYRKILLFLNVHDTCTVSVCNEKLRNDLIKGTGHFSSLLLVLKPCALLTTSRWSLGSFGESLFSLLDKLNKLVLTHSNFKLIKLSNNPSGKKVILLASISL